MAAPVTPPDTGNSRESAAKAGWRERGWPFHEARWRQMLLDRKRNFQVNFFWINPAPLLASVNDKVVKGLADLINEVRPRWVAAQRAGGALDGRPRVSEHADKERFSFLVLGDPGEQDASQYAVVDPLLEAGKKTDFMIIDSDVIYPAGDIDDYIDGFYLPYGRYRQPIYAIPGNHDWYDGLNGFMFHFCGAEPLPPIVYRSGSYSWKERLARILWRKPSPPDLPALLFARQKRAQIIEERIDARWKPPQPAPYFTIETKSLLIVCIDTGITGVLDREQGEWLRDVSLDPRPKLLVTGKPIYVDGKYEPGGIDWGAGDDPEIDKEVRAEGYRTVDDIVRDRRHRYVSVIGGDVHNYQRYSVVINDDGNPEEGPPPGPELPDGSLRGIEYVVTGGGGAYLSATHRFKRVDLDPRRTPKRKHHPLPKNIAPITEDDFRCYPLRGDSLARFARRFVPGYALALASAWVVLGFLAWLFFGPLEGGGEQLGQFANAKVSNGFWIVPATLAAAAGVVIASVFLSNLVVPRGSQTLTATTLGAALVALLILGANEIFGEAWNGWIWRLAVSTLLAIAVPVVVLVGYYLLRDFFPESVRAGIGMAILLAAVAVWVGSGTDLVGAELLLVGLALLALWLSVLGLGWMRTLPRTKEGRRKRFTRYRRVVARCLPAVAGVLGLVLAFHDAGWLATGVVTAFGFVVFYLTAIALVLGLLGIPAAGVLLPGQIDPDMTARWLADRVKIEPTRVAAREAEPDLKSRVLAALTYWSLPYRFIMSELAEATTPPFFKSFVRVDVDERELVITAYGVSGWAEDEATPTVEDRVPIPL